MNAVSYEILSELLINYSLDDMIKIKKAYDMAASKHYGQKRQSGEDYIIHPLNVAYILAEMHADADTICAGLLHDTLEDTNTTKEELIIEFNEDVANLVDGVTKISKLNFSSKEEQNLANTRKIITSITSDVRIIIIKLADRLHNMRTLEFKSEYKQKENSLETIELFAPLAYYIGAYRIKSELEDISFHYLKPDEYKRVEEEKILFEESSQDCIREMINKIQTIMNDSNIPYELKERTKNIYGIYKRELMGHKINDIHDLIALKLMVNSIPNCYLTLMYLHSAYKPLNNKFKDFIYSTKTNMYQSLHTTLFGPDNKLVQAQIRTFEMDKIASFGLTAYWDINKENAHDIMQKELKEKYQFYKSLTEIDKMFSANEDFVKQIKQELLTEKIYVYTPDGDYIELPLGATIIDFAYKVGLGDSMIGALVNNNEVTFNYVLNNKDIVIIKTDNKIHVPSKECLDCAKTTFARRKIQQSNINK